MSDPVTFRKMNIFFRDFFKPYLLDLKTPFLAFSRHVQPPKKSCGPSKWPSKKGEYHFFHEIKNQNLQFRFEISGKPQKWTFQIEDNIYIQFPIEKITFQLKNTRLARGAYPAEVMTASVSRMVTTSGSKRANR